MKQQLKIKYNMVISKYLKTDYCDQVVCKMLQGFEKCPSMLTIICSISLNKFKANYIENLFSK